MPFLNFITANISVIIILTLVFSIFKLCFWIGWYCNTSDIKNLNYEILKELKKLNGEKIVDENKE